MIAIEDIAAEASEAARQASEACTLALEAQARITEEELKKATEEEQRRRATETEFAACEEELSKLQNSFTSEEVELKSSLVAAKIMFCDEHRVVEELRMVLEAKQSEEIAARQAETSGATVDRLQQELSDEQTEVATLLREIESLGERVYRAGAACEQWRSRAEEAEASIPTSTASGPSVRGANTLGTPRGSGRPNSQSLRPPVPATGCASARTLRVQDGHRAENKAEGCADSRSSGGGSLPPVRRGGRK